MFESFLESVVTRLCSLAVEHHPVKVDSASSNLVTVAAPVVKRISQ